MKELGLLLTLCLFSASTLALEKVIKPGEDSLHDDSQFKLQVVSKQNQRAVASEVEEVTQNDHEKMKNEDNTPKKKREIANQPEVDNKLEYWSY